jgi:hypothetical protein
LIRDAIAVVVGLATGFVLVYAIQKIGHTIYPPSKSLDINDVEAMRTYISQLPLLALLFPIISYFFGALGGSLAACAVGTARPAFFVGIIGLILLTFTIANLIWIPHPHWFSAFAIAVVVGGALLAMRLATAISGTETRDGDPG